jgi:hypothetical protein
LRSGQRARDNFINPKPPIIAVGELTFRH